MLAVVALVVMNAVSHGTPSRRLAATVAGGRYGPSNPDSEDCGLWIVDCSTVPQSVVALATTYHKYTSYSSVSVT